MTPPPPPYPLPHPRALAHLGDAVYELWIRELAIAAHDKNVDLHRFTIERVKAETQANLLEQLLSTLSDEERALLKRAENVPVTSSRRANQALHRKSTGFEALIGYWYLCGEEAIAPRKAVILAELSTLFSEKLSPPEDTLGPATA